MGGKTNYDRLMQQIMQRFAGEMLKPKLLLHVCCAPCSTAVMERLETAFLLVVLFDNPNLDTGEEHGRRAAETQRLIQEKGLTAEVIITPYDPDSYLAAVRGQEDSPEGGSRCHACFALRLGNAARMAKDLACDWFTTTLTISPHKDAGLLNHLGEQAGKAAGVPFLPSDFKKGGGYQRSLLLSREHHLYRQDYCGCVFSRQARDKRKASQ